MASFKPITKSNFKRFLLFFIDCLIVGAAVIKYFSFADYLVYFLCYCLVGWWLISSLVGFYKVYRFTPLVQILKKILFQSLCFAIIVYAFFGMFSELLFSRRTVLILVLQSILIVAFVKILIFNILKSIRIYFKKDLRKIIIIGENQKSRQLADFFTKNAAYGYQLFQQFAIDKSMRKLEEVLEYASENGIDEIYSSTLELENRHIERIVIFAAQNNMNVKFLTDNRRIFNKRMRYQYYGITPILQITNTPLDNPANKILKRTFDILLALAVITLILSWLTPLLAILIKFESKGPVIFKQKRNGLDYHTFYCYKFRSMRVNREAHLEQVTLGDKRITSLGKFLRKTSIDELPQFFNVLLGNMSVVGPRPHMVSHTEKYAASIDRFMVRHLVKPGITGLAQISGYRGEVRDARDIKNRVRFDIFYLENWSILMDLRIIAKTMLHIIKGDPKAY